MRFCKGFVCGCVLTGIAAESTAEGAGGKVAGFLSNAVDCPVGGAQQMLGFSDAQFLQIGGKVLAGLLLERRGQNRRIQREGFSNAGKGKGAVPEICLNILLDLVDLADCFALVAFSA